MSLYTDNKGNLVEKGLFGRERIVKKAEKLPPPPNPEPEQPTLIEQLLNNQETIYRAIKELQTPQPVVADSFEEQIASVVKRLEELEKKVKK